MLTGRQIDRYSRQIITPGFGGAAQERLLASRMLVSGRLVDLEPILPYLVGAGIGHIALNTDGESPAIGALQRRFADLNPDVEVTEADRACNDYDLILAFAGDDLAVDGFSAYATEYSRSPLICVRLAAAAAIAIIPSRPPCLACADADLIAPLIGQCENPAAITMMAAIEAIRLLAGIAAMEARLIEFDGYAATSRPLHHRHGAISCGCSAAAT
jgi:molybdopterin/thiamine biosynthesis adenylyltransferase